METTKLATLAVVATVSYFTGRMVTLKKIEDNLRGVAVLNVDEQRSIIDNVMAAHGFIKVI